MAKNEDVEVVIPPTPKRDTRALRARKERARQADLLMKNPLLQEGLDAIEKTIEKGWKETSAEETEARERAYLLHRLVVDLRQRFRSILVDGQAADALLARTEDEPSARGNKR